MEEEQAKLAGKKQYPLSRDFHASARLQIQHLLWNIRLGYLLHPSISTVSLPSIRIADIGTGNALWPLELSRHLPSTAQISGYDISPAQFPAEEWLPPNVHLGILDALSGELPKELVNAFDVVHLRAFAVVIKGGDPGGVIGRLCEMLKPGGYLQWDEVDIGAYQAQSPNAAIGNAASEKLAQHFLAYVDECGFKFDWTRNLPEVFAAAGLGGIQAAQLPLGNAMRRFETDNHLMALEDTLPDMARHFAEKEQATFEEVNRDMHGLLQGAVEEAGRGVSLTMEWYSCLGCKSG